MTPSPPNKSLSDSVSNLPEMMADYLEGLPILVNPLPGFIQSTVLSSLHPVQRTSSHFVENISPEIVVSEVEPIQSVAEEDCGKGGSQEEPHHGHCGFEVCYHSQSSLSTLPQSSE